MKFWDSSNSLIPYFLPMISRSTFIAEKIQQIEEETKRLAQVHVSIGANDLLRSLSSTELNSGTTLAELLKRPEVSYKALAPIDPERPSLPEDVTEQVELYRKTERAGREI